jgi:hypothetical protein
MGSIRKQPQIAGGRDHKKRSPHPRRPVAPPGLEPKTAFWGQPQATEGEPRATGGQPGLS